MSKGKLFSVLCALLVAVVGGLYLLFDFFSIPFVLCIACGAVGVMGTVSVLEARSENKRDLASYIPAMCYFVLALAVLIASVVYMLG